MKTLKLLSLLLFVPLVFHAQKSLTGLWIGTLSNDSTTMRKDQSFEIALTQYKEKVYGYSRSTFIINDTLYYILKRVKGTIDGEICEVKDDEIVSYNFRGRLDKGIKVTTTFRRNLQDSAWHLAGEWKTNKTKKFYSISGKVNLKEEANYEKSKIFPHLEELKIDKELEFYVTSKKPAPPVAETRVPTVTKKEEKQQTQPIIAKAEPQKSPGLPSNSIAKEQKKDIGNPSSTTPEIKQQGIAVTREETQKASEEAIASSTIKKSVLPASSLPAEQKKNVDAEIPKPEIKKQDIIVKRSEPVPVAASSQGSPVADTRVAVTKKEQQTQPTPTRTEPQKLSELPSYTIAKEQKKDIGNPSSTAPEIKQQGTVVTKEETQKASEEAIASSTIKKSVLPASTLPAEQKKNVGAEMPKPEIKNQDIISEPVPATETIEPKTETKKPDPASIAKSTEENKVITRETLQPEFKISSAAAFVEQRKTVVPQVVEFKSDSLELKLYDNGEIDGDTVSILLNGEILLTKQGLKASAIKKTIYIQPGSNEITLVLYAENLGKYPPNTGLLVVHDGEDVYQVRFSADLQQNAAVIFRRKK